MKNIPMITQQAGNVNVAPTQQTEDVNIQPPTMQGLREFEGDNQPTIPDEKFYNQEKQTYVDDIHEQTHTGQNLGNMFENDQLGIDLKNVKYQLFPPARAYKVAKEGLTDGVVGLVYSEKRAADFYFSEPIFEGPLVFFYYRDLQFDWNHYQGLKKIKNSGKYDQIIADFTK